VPSSGRSHARKAQAVLLNAGSPAGRPGWHVGAPSVADTTSERDSHCRSPTASNRTPASDSPVRLLAFVLIPTSQALPSVASAVSVAWCLAVGRSPRPHSTKETPWGRRDRSSSIPADSSDRERRSARLRRAEVAWPFGTAGRGGAAWGFRLGVLGGYISALAPREDVGAFPGPACAVRSQNR